MRILIKSRPLDLHSDAVVWALEQASVPADVWVPVGPGVTPCALSIPAEGEAAFLSGGPLGPIDGYSAVWFRRSPLAERRPALDPQDEEFLLRELHFFHRGLNAALGGIRLQANPLEAAAAASLKLVQLQAAAKAGFAIPVTLSTSDLDGARRFLSEAPSCVYKTHSPAVWVDHDSKALFTTNIAASDLLDVAPEEFNPALIQHRVDKSFELRVAVFGRTYICAKLESPSLDWRVRYDIKLSPFALSDDTRVKIDRLMTNLGLTMGMIDLLVTPEGEMVFLEINPQGQFLWVEALEPSIAVLAPFAQFLASADPFFEWDGDRRGIFHGAYLQSECHAALKAARMRAPADPPSHVGVDQPIFSL